MNFLGNKLLEESKNGEINPYDLYEESVTALLRVSEQASKIKVITAVKGLMEYITLEPKDRKSTGLDLLDARFNGGVFETDLVTIGARPPQYRDWETAGYRDWETGIVTGKQVS